MITYILNIDFSLGPATASGLNELVGVLVLPKRSTQSRIREAIPTLHY